MVREHHQLNGYEFELVPGDSERQGSLACYTVHGVSGTQTDLLLNNSSSCSGGSLFLFMPLTGSSWRAGISLCSIKFSGAKCQLLISYLSISSVQSLSPVRLFAKPMSISSVQFRWV